MSLFLIGAAVFLFVPPWIVGWRSPLLIVFLIPPILDRLWRATASPTPSVQERRRLDLVLVFIAVVGFLWYLLGVRTVAIAGSGVALLLIVRAHVWYVQGEGSPGNSSGGGATEAGLS